MSKPRLLIFLNRLAIGGPAMDTLSAAAALCNDFEILLLAGEALPDEEPADFLLHQYKGFRVVRIPSLQRTILPFQDIRSYYQVKKIIRDFKPEIIHTHGAKPGVVGRLAAWRLKVPVIIHTFHGHVFHSYFNAFLSKRIVWVERMLATISTAIIAISRSLKNELELQYKIAPSEKLKLIRLGIETAHFNDTNGQKRNQFRKEFALSEQEVAIGIVGRLVPVKQHTLFIDIAIALLQTVKEPIRFFIIGNGPEKQKLEQILQQHQVQYTSNSSAIDPLAKIVFTSWRQDMDVVYNGLDMVMLTSLNEGTPVSIMEAMSAAKPVISTAVGGVAEMIVSGKTGFIGNNQSALVSQAEQLITDPNQRKLIGEMAKEFAELQFSKTAEIEQIKALYHQLMKEQLKHS